MPLCPRCPSWPEGVCASATPATTKISKATDRILLWCRTSAQCSNSNNRARPSSARANGPHTTSKWLMSERDQSQLLLMTRAGTLVLVLAATAALSGTAIAQTQSQKPSQQEPSPPADGALQPDAPSTTEPSLVSGIRLPLIHFPETSDAAEVRKRFGTISPDPGVRALYGDFSGNPRFGRVNPNAPWKVGGRLTYSIGQWNRCENRVLRVRQLTGPDIHE